MPSADRGCRAWRRPRPSVPGRWHRRSRISWDFCSSHGGRPRASLPDFRCRTCARRLHFSLAGGGTAFNRARRSSKRRGERKMAEIKNPARAPLEAGEVSIGVGLRLARGAEIGRIMKSCGWDWLFIDLEHGSMTLDTACQISVAALDAGIAPIVRIPNGQLDMATRALDGGGWGIVMPHVDTAEEAAELVA